MDIIFLSIDSSTPVDPTYPPFVIPSSWNFDGDWDARDNMHLGKQVGISSSGNMLRAIGDNGVITFIVSEDHSQYEGNYANYSDSWHAMTVAKSGRTQWAFNMFPYQNTYVQVTAMYHIDDDRGVVSVPGNSLFTPTETPIAAAGADFEGKNILVLNQGPDGGELQILRHNPDTLTTSAWVNELKTIGYPSASFRPIVRGCTVNGVSRFHTSIGIYDYNTETGAYITHTAIPVIADQLYDIFVAPNEAFVAYLYLRAGTIRLDVFRRNSGTNNFELVSSGSPSGLMSSFNDMTMTMSDVGNSLWVGSGINSIVFSYVADIETGTYTSTGTLTQEAGDGFGSSLDYANDANVLLVGAPNAEMTNQATRTKAGRVYYMNLSD